MTRVGGAFLNRRPGQLPSPTESGWRGWVPQTQTGSPLGAEPQTQTGSPCKLFAWEAAAANAGEGVAKGGGEGKVTGKGYVTQPVITEDEDNWGSVLLPRGSGGIYPPAPCPSDVEACLWGY